MSNSLWSVLALLLCSIYELQGFLSPPKLHTRSVVGNYRLLPMHKFNKQGLNNMAIDAHVQGIALDTPIIPLVHYTNSITLVISLAIALTLAWNLVYNTPRIYVRVLDSSFFLNLKLGVKVMIAKLSLLLDNAVKRWNLLINGVNNSYVDISKWNICALQSKQLLRGHYIRYRLSLSKPYNELHLAPGQEVVLCAADNLNKALKESFFPVTSPNSRGCFDIIVKRDSSAYRAGELSRLLDTLPIGSEIAFKGGKQNLRFKGLEDKIKGITIFSSGSGIAISVQILRGLMSLRDIHVEDIEHVWLNEDKKEFVLEKEIEQLELQNFETITTTKILGKGMFSKDLGLSSNVNVNVKPYESGRVAIVCAPSHYTNQIAQYLINYKKYPSNSVAVLSSK